MVRRVVFSKHAMNFDILSLDILESNCTKAWFVAKQSNGNFAKSMHVETEL